MATPLGLADVTMSDDGSRTHTHRRLRLDLAIPPAPDLRRLIGESMTQTAPLPRGADLALRGLELAHGRLREGVNKYLRGEGGALVTVALSEALYWIAVADYHGLKHVNDYSQKRDSSPGGHTVCGLGYARNFEAHELISTTDDA